MAYKYAVIGYGFIGRRHVNTLKKFEQSDCVVVCDINLRRLQEVKELYPDMAVYEKAKDMFANEKLDGVIISANNTAHKYLTILAAESGCDIICEKPAALTVAEFDEMMEAVEKAGVSFTVHQQRRFDKDFATVKVCYDGRLVGDIYTIQSSLYGFSGNMRHGETLFNVLNRMQGWCDSPLTGRGISDAKKARFTAFICFRRLL